MFAIFQFGILILAVLFYIDFNNYTFFGGFLNDESSVYFSAFKVLMLKRIFHGFVWFMALLLSGCQKNTTTASIKSFLSPTCFCFLRISRPVSLRPITSWVNYSLALGLVSHTGEVITNAKIFILWIIL